MNQTPEPQSPNSKNKLIDLLMPYAEKWLPEIINLLKRLKVAIIIIAIGFVVFLLGILVLISYALVRYFGA